MLKNYLEINTIIISIFGTTILGGLIKIYRHARGIYCNQEKRFNNLELSIKNLIRDKLFVKMVRAIDLGYVTIEELDVVTFLYRDYKGFKGNTFIDNLYDKFKKLPIKEIKNDIKR